MTVRRHAQPGIPARPVAGSPRFARRGQALILAVLVMFLLAGLGGVFIALIGQAMTQTVRAEERNTLEGVLKTGLRHAQNELLYSADGADWRPDDGPDAANPGWTRGGGGFFRIHVGYGPQSEGALFGASQLDRMVKVKVEARLALENKPDVDASDPEYDAYRRGFYNPKRFLVRSITAYQPIGLTDYLLWITNLDGSPEPAVLGSAFNLDYENEDKTDGDSNPDNDEFLFTLRNMTDYSGATAEVRGPYLPVYEGPIRSEGSLQVADAAIYLTNKDSAYAQNFQVQRQDLIEVVGKLSAYDGASAVNRRLMVNQWAQSLPNGTDLTQGSVDIRYVHTRDNDPLLKRMRPPQLDRRSPSGLHRYRALTRDSGVWEALTTNSAYNTGYIGQGEGIYIDNPHHVQYQGSLARLRENWLAATGENWVTVTDPIDNSVRRSYQPKDQAVIVELHDWEPKIVNNATVFSKPFIRLYWSDTDPTLPSFRDANNNDPLHVGDYYTVDIPYPRNGVLFAEGNLIVRGELATSERYIPDLANAGYYQPTAEVGGSSTTDDGVRYYVDDSNRRFDLTIVSGATIYIDDNVLAPSTHTQGEVGDRLIKPDDWRDSKLALLAMDYICLNPTGYNMPEINAQSAAIAGYLTARAGDPVRLTLKTAGKVTNNTRIVLRHAGLGWDMPNNVVAMKMSVNGKGYYPWSLDPADTEWDRFYFCRNSATQFSMNIPDLRVSNKFYEPDWELNSWPGRRNGLDLNGYGGSNVLEFFRWDNSTTDYLLKDALITNADLQVDALMYAQRGSWFVIPGTYRNSSQNFNNPYRPYGQSWPVNWDYPLYNEPSDLQIIVNGAIVENRPAPAEAQEQWMRMWRGANKSYYDTDGDGLADNWDPAASGWDSGSWRWPNRRMGIVYHYDATLARPVCYDVADGVRYYRPRLPKLPVSPDLYTIERMRSL